MLEEPSLSSFLRKRSKQISSLSHYISKFEQGIFETFYQIHHRINKSLIIREWSFRNRIFIYLNIFSTLQMLSMIVSYNPEERDGIFWAILKISTGELLIDI